MDKNLNSQNRLILLTLFILAFVLILPKISLAQPDFELTINDTDCFHAEPWVKLGWEATGSSPVYYVLRKTTEEPEYTEIYSTTSLSFTDYGYGLLSDKSYNYQIRAEDGGTFFSDVETITALYCPPYLYIPTQSCEPDGPRLNLTWDPISGDLNTYEIYRAEGQDEPGPFSFLSNTISSSYSDGPNISGLTKYWYYIKALWLDGSTNTSELRSEVAPTCPPTLSANEFCENVTTPGGPQVNLSWNELLGALEYQIYRNVRGGKWNPLGSPLSGTSYTDKLVESLFDYEQGGTVQYRVQVGWPGGYYDNSNITQITIPRCPPFLTVESNCDEFFMRLSWTATEGVAHYNIWRATNTPPVYTFYKQIYSPTTTFTDGLDFGKCPYACTRVYKVVGIGGGEDAISNEVIKDIDCLTSDPPSPPNIEQAKAFCESGDSRISLSWEGSDNILYYTILRNTLDIGSTASTSYTDPSLESGYDYTYQIMAVGPGGTTTSENATTLTAVNCDQPGTPPGTPPVLTLNEDCAAGAPFVNLSWTETANTYSYDIWRGITSDNLSSIRTFDKSNDEFYSRNWDDYGVLISTTYYYQVVANGPPGVSPSTSTTGSKNTSDCYPTTPILTLSTDCVGLSPVVNLSWSTDEDNTVGYDIFRADWSTSTIHQCYKDVDACFYDKDWQDTNVDQESLYNYKVEAVGYLGRTSTEGYQPINTYYCQAPGGFSISYLSDYCSGSFANPYPWTDLSWTDSENALSYDLNRYLYDNGSIIETTTLSDVTSPYADRGLGKALSFPGFYNKYVQIPNSESLREATTSVSMEAWIYPIYSSSYSARYGAIVGYINGYYRNRIYVDNYVSGGPQLRSYFYFYGGSGQTFLSGPKLTYNNWNHIVYVYDGTKQFLYLNGEEKASSNRSGSLRTGNYSIRIGDGYYSYNQFKGEIDEVRIYNRALSPTEILEHYQGIYTDQTELRGLWHFDEGSGNNVSDSSNYGNNGTRRSGITWVENGPQCENKYSWQAIANNIGGSVFSDITNPQPMPICAPSKPGLVLNPICQGERPSVRISWSFSINATGYNIYRDGNLVTNTSVIDPDPSNRIFIDDDNGSGLATGTAYTYWVEASGIATTESDHLEVTTLDCILPGSTEGLQVSFDCGDYGSSCLGSYPRVWLEWRETLNANYYEIWRMVGTGSYSSLATTTATSATDAYPSVKVNIDYSYYIKAHSLGGTSISNVASTTTGFCPPCQASINAYSTNCYGDSPSPVNKIYWSDRADFNAKRYEVYRDTVDVLPAGPIDTIATGTDEFSAKFYKDDNSSLNVSTTYYYWVKTISYPGVTPNEKISDSESISTYDCNSGASQPNPPGVATDCCDDLPCNTVTWSDVGNAYSYNIYRTDGDTSVYSTRLSALTDEGSFSLDFDGNDYLYTQGTVKSTKEFAIEAWIYPTPSSAYRGIIGRINGEYYYGGYTNWIRLTSADYLHANIKWENCSDSSFSGPIVTENQWNHIVLVYDGEYLRWYLNGIENPTTQKRVGCTMRQDNYSMRIGRDSYPYYYFRGKIDEVRFYGRALTAQEVQDHFNGIYKNELKLKGVWHFDEGSGTTAYDSSGNGKNCTFSGNPQWVSTSSENIYVPSLEEGTPYTYQVSACGIGQESSLSNGTTETTPFCGLRIDSFGVTAQCSAGDSQMELVWDVVNAEAVTIWKDKFDGDYPSPSLIDTVSTSSTPYIDSDVESRADYEYFIEAIMGVESIFSTFTVTTTAKICGDVPEEPQITKVAPKCVGNDSRIEVEWTTGGAGILSFDILRRDEACPGNGSSKVNIEAIPPVERDYTDFDIVEAQDYCYKVRAIGSGEDNFFDSLPMGATSLNCQNQPPYPALLELNYIESTWEVQRVSLRWRPQNGEEFDVWRNDIGVIGTTSIADCVNDNGDKWCYYRDDTVTENITYQYIIKSENPYGGPTDSNSLDVYIPIAPPGRFTLWGEWIGEMGKKARLYWDKADSGVGGDVKYVVLRDDTKDFVSPREVCEETPDLECYDKNPDSSEPFYKAVATNKGGSTDSNRIEMQFSPPIPIWEEVFPY